MTREGIRSGGFSRTVHDQAWCDLKVRWQRGLFWALCLFCFYGLCFGLVLSLLVPPHSFKKDNACLPDGSFSVDPSKYNYWDASGFFQITMGFGALTFTQAKAIDIVWDVMIGRGGQAILAIISWRVFRGYVTSSMSSTPVTFQTFYTIFLRQEASLVGILRLLKDFSFRHGLHSITAMSFMITTIAFILAFPTLGSAMAGYSGNVQSFVKDHDGNYVSFDSFNYLYYIVHNGSRIGVTDDFPVTGYKLGGDPLLLSAERLDVCMEALSRIVSDARCSFLRDVISYFTQYGLIGSTEGPMNMSSRFGKFDLSSPTLHIEPFPLSDYFYRLASMPGDIANSIEQRPMTWTANGHKYDAAYIIENGRCQALKTYKWGFSYIQLNIIVILLLLWMVGTYTLYLRTYITLRNRVNGNFEVAGQYKAVLQLANAVQEQFNQELEKDEVSDITVLSESQICQRIYKCSNGGSMTYRSRLLHESSDPEGMGYRFGLRTWIEKEKYWIAALVLATVAMCLSLGYLFVIPLCASLLLPFEISFVMYVGKQGESRAVLLFWIVLWLNMVPMIATSQLSMKKFRYSLY